ncbi:hypothetical protein [Sorangium sp. So ce128]|uniref:hypothetical protein n=1 Tax=Sorangium sp. So ce128 TaxID=3133281 RepID=UPI003F648248
MSESMLPSNEITAIYGAAGASGAASAKEGARLFLTGRELAPVQALADEIVENLPMLREPRAVLVGHEAEGDAICARVGRAKPCRPVKNFLPTTGG